MLIEPQGKKEVKEAVLIGVIVAIGSSIANWCIEEVRQKFNEWRKNRTCKKQGDE